MAISVPENTPVGDEAAPAAAVAYYRIARQSAPNGSTVQVAVAEQRQHVERRAAELGVTIAEEFTDIGTPGTTTDRPGLRQLFERVYAGGVTHCIMDHRYRLARTVADGIALERELKRHGVTVVAAADESGDLVQSMIDAITAEEERHQLAALSDEK